MAFDDIFKFSIKEVDKQKHYYDVIALKNTYDFQYVISIHL